MSILSREKHAHYRTAFLLIVLVYAILAFAGFTGSSYRLRNLARKPYR